MAVAAVVAFHLGFGWAKGGFLGVSAFFTLSGYLITTLLVTEHDTHGRIDLRAFWARRARRLQPAAVVALGGAVLFGATVADASQRGALRGDVLAALGQVANWRFVASGRSYTALFATPSPVQHFWSLAVEEQAYVVVPLLVVAALRLARGRRWVLPAVLAAAAVASAVRQAAVVGTDAGWAYYGTDARAAELLIGALLAATWGRGSRRVDDWIAARAGVAAAGALAVLWLSIGQADRHLYRGGFALHALLVAVVIVAAHAEGPLRTGLSWRPLVVLGERSYAVYLVHWPVFLWLAGSSVALRLGVTAALAGVLSAAVERPIRARRRLVGSRLGYVGLAAAAAVVVALLAVTAGPPPPTIALPPSAFAAVYARATTATTVRPVPPARATTVKVPPGSVAAATPIVVDLPIVDDRPTRVLVVGDSVAASFGVGLDDWGQLSGRAVVRNDGHVFCGIGRGGDIAVGDGVRPQSDACNDWADRWAADLADFQPDVVVVLSTIWDLGGHRQHGWSDFLQVGDPTYDTWLLGEYVAAADLLGSTGARVAWLTAPCTTPDVADPADVRFLDDHVIADLLRLRPAVTGVDLDAAICPGGAFTATVAGVPDARPDGLHFSEGGADATAGLLGPQIVALRRR